jgi:hypothetical protein
MSRIVLVLIGLCLVVGGAFWLVNDAFGLPSGNITYQQLLSRPESHLYYPGAKAIESHGDGVRQGLPNFPAFVQTYLVVSDVTWQQVDDWYRTKLTASGWRSDLKIDFGASYVRGDREDFTIGFPRIAPPGVPWDGKGTLYNIHYQIAP